MKGILPNLGHWGTWFVDVLINFWDQWSKVKVTASNDPKSRVNTISS